MGLHTAPRRLHIVPGYVLAAALMTDNITFDIRRVFAYSCPPKHIATKRPLERDCAGPAAAPWNEKSGIKAKLLAKDEARRIAGNIAELAVQRVPKG